VIAAKEIEMSSREAPETEAPETSGRPPSDAENAMAANARSRDRQGKAEDKALREHDAGMTGDRAKKQTLRQPAPEARSISDARQDASADERAADEGMGEPRKPPRGPSARP
jgi:hypothetical protein